MPHHTTMSGFDFGGDSPADAYQYGQTPYNYGASSVHAHRVQCHDERQRGWAAYLPRGTLQRCALLTALAFAGWWAVSVGYSEFLVFRDLLGEKNKNYEEAYNYIHSPKSMCQDENADYRVRVGPMFDQCWSAKRVVESSPWTEACIDLLKRWRICTNGSCTVFSFDFFNALPFLFNAVLFTCMAIGAYVLFKIIAMIYGNFQRNNELPLCATPTQLAAMAFQKDHQPYQQSAPTHKKVF